MKRTLTMRGTISFPMLDGETIEEAEERLFDALDTVDTIVSTWSESKIWEDDEDETD